MSCIFSPSNPVLLWKRGRGERGRKAFSLSLWGASRVFSTKKVFLIAPEKKREKVGLRRAFEIGNVFFSRKYSAKKEFRPLSPFSLSSPSLPFSFNQVFLVPWPDYAAERKKRKKGNARLLGGSWGFQNVSLFWKLSITHLRQSPKHTHDFALSFLLKKEQDRGGEANDLVRFHRRQKNGKCGGLDYVIKVFSPSRNFMLDLFLHSLLKIPLFPAQNLLWFWLTCFRSCYRAPVNPIGTKNFLFLNFWFF